MKKVAIIGRGTAGAQAALHFSAWADGFEVEWHFDDSIKPQSVGEGSTLTLPSNLRESYGFTFQDLNKIGGTMKTGVFKKNWTESCKDFYHPFFPPNVAIHFQAHMLQQFALEKLDGKVKLHKEFVGSHDDIDADYIVDCSGTPKQLDDRFNLSDSVPLNTAKVWQCPWDAPTFDYTLAIAGKYGWVFGIPLTNRCSIGYIYNRDFATLEQVEEDVQQVFQDYNVKPGPDGNYIEFNSYWRKTNFTDRVAYNGNASFFLEPLEATSTAAMDQIQRSAFDIVTGGSTVELENNRYSDFMSRTEAMLMLHYLGKPKFKNDFWEFANQRARKRFEQAKDDNLLKSHIITALDELKTEKVIFDKLPQYSTWGSFSFTAHIKNMGLEAEMAEFLS
jgi:hypothetical protein